MPFFLGKVQIRSSLLATLWKTLVFVIADKNLIRYFLKNLDLCFIFEEVRFKREKRICTKDIL